MPKLFYTIDEGENEGLLLGSDATVIRGEKSKQLSFYGIPLDWFDKNAVVAHNSPGATVLLLLNVMIGSGILSQPYVFKEAGVVACLVLYVVLAVMMFIGIDILMISSEVTGMGDLYKLAFHILGSNGGILVDTSIAINSFGCLLAYFMLVGSISHSLLRENFSVLEWYTESYWIVVGFSVVFVLPLCLIRQFGNLAWVSYFSMATITGVVVLVIVSMPMISLSDMSKQNSMNVISTLGTLRVSGSIIFAFNMTSATFHAYNSLVPKTRKMFLKVVAASLVLGVTECFIVGLVGYATFLANTREDLLDNYKDGWLANAMKVAIIVHLVLYIPGDFIIMKHSLLSLLGRDSIAINNKLHFGITFGLVSIVCVLSFLILLSDSVNASFDLLLNLTGGVAGSLVCFIVPGLIGANLFVDFTYWVLSFILLTFGVSVVLLVCISSWLSYS